VCVCVCVCVCMYVCMNDISSLRVNDLIILIRKQFAEHLQEQAKQNLNKYIIRKLLNLKCTHTIWTEKMAWP
jgi:hypothetical protein